MAKPCRTRKSIVCGVISYASLQIVVISLQHGFKTSQTNLSEQGKFLLAELGRGFLEVESKGYIYMTGKCWEKGSGNLFNSQKPNSINRDLSQLQGRWRRLKLQSKRDHGLHSREKWTTS